MAPVGPVAVVALHGDHLTRDVDDLVRLDKGQRLGHGDERLRLVVSAAKATSDQHVESAQGSLLRFHRHDREVVRVDVDAVVAL